jgi:hypothetical protein
MKAHRESPQQLQHYAQVLALWGRRFDTAEIAAIVRLPEGLVAKWIANWRDMERGTQ